jgi:hypothetical protein
MDLQWHALSQLTPCLKNGLRSTLMPARRKRMVSRGAFSTKWIVGVVLKEAKP